MWARMRVRRCSPLRAKLFPSHLTPALDQPPPPFTFVPSPVSKTRFRRQRICDVPISVCESPLWSFSGPNEPRTFFFYTQRRYSGPIPRCSVTPPPSFRTHSTTLVRRKIVTVDSGEGASYYNCVHVFDILMRRRSRSTFMTTDMSRVHYSVLPEQNLGIRRVETGCRRRTTSGGSTSAVRSIGCVGSKSRYRDASDPHCTDIIRPIFGVS